MSLHPTPFLATIAVLALVAGFTPSSVSAQQQGDCDGVPHCGPYNEDPGEPCLGPNDPFCNGGGGGGGGGSTGQCQVCDLTCDSNNNCTASCDDNMVGETGKSECEVTQEGEEISCQTWGTTCVSV